MNKLVSIQFLRAFACFLVLMTHVLQILNIKPFGNYYISGGYGVDLFFIISGFLIYITTRDTDSWKVFVIKRTFRIFPLYWFVLSLFFLFHVIEKETVISIKYAIQNILMLPWDSYLTTRSLLVGVAWSTVYELYFYLVFSIVLFLNINKKFIIALLLSLLLVVKALHALNPFNFVQCGFFNFIYSIVGRTFIIPFIVGILMAMFYKSSLIESVISKNRLLFKFLFISSIALFIITLSTQYSQFKSYLVSSAVFFFMLMLDYIFKINYESILCKVFSILGDISFSIYLLHGLVIDILVSIFKLESILIVMFFSVLITVISSYITYNFIEKPFIDKSKYLVAKYTIKTCQKKSF